MIGSRVREATHGQHGRTHLHRACPVGTTPVYFRLVFFFNFHIFQSTYHVRYIPRRCGTVYPNPCERRQLSHHQHPRPRAQTMRNLYACNEKTGIFHLSLAPAFFLPFFTALLLVDGMLPRRQLHRVQRMQFRVWRSNAQSRPFFPSHHTYIFIFLICCV